MEGTVKQSASARATRADSKSTGKGNPLEDSFLNPSENTDDNSPLEPIPLPTNSRIKQIWAIGGGKGGVGKSLVASSLAISLSRLGNKVVAIDLDLGGANLHTTLGVDLPKQTLSDFLNHKVSDIESCVVPTGIPYLSLISGAQDSIGVANLKLAQKVEFLTHVRKLDADYLVFDLGAGTSYNTLDFFLYADIGLITLLPEPTSIENSYRFIKSAYFRHLMSRSSLHEVRPLIEMAMDAKNPLGIKSPADLFKEVNKANPEAGMRLKQEIEKFQPKLVVNQARTQTDIDIGVSIKAVCKKYFGIEMDYIGHLDYDSSVWQSVRRKRPMMVEFPNSKIVSNIEEIVHHIIKFHNFKKSVTIE
jgi:flagellar biosynthesis protein FlhG